MKIRTFQNYTRTSNVDVEIYGASWWCIMETMIILHSPSWEYGEKIMQHNAPRVFQKFHVLVKFLDHYFVGHDEIHEEVGHMGILMGSV